MTIITRIASGQHPNPVSPRRLGSARPDHRRNCARCERDFIVGGVRISLNKGKIMMLAAASSPAPASTDRTGPLSPVALHRRRLAQRLARDPDADGRFWCSVVTTGIYCRPSCPSRHARPDHIRFHDTLDDARRTGFRPCRRCHPDGRGLTEERRFLVDKACEIIRRSGGAATTAEVAQALGVSPSHLYRVFQQVLKQTPGTFARSIPREPKPSTIRCTGSASLQGRVAK